MNADEYTLSEQPAGWSLDVGGWKSDQTSKSANNIERTALLSGLYRHPSIFDHFLAADQIWQFNSAWGPYGPFEAWYDRLAARIAETNLEQYVKLRDVFEGTFNKIHSNSSY